MMDEKRLAAVLRAEDEKRLAAVLRAEAGKVTAGVGVGRGPRAPEPASFTRKDIQDEAMRTMALGWHRLAEALDPS